MRGYLRSIVLRALYLVVLWAGLLGGAFAAGWFVGLLVP
jgi:hypothetical protein